ncbi:ribonuclease D [Chromatiaceae bacterium AAb-1]|nr:ribonuclease D [Chromatiaceae bacterium AAb-1]
MTQLITENETLAHFCRQALSRPLLAVDTEFIRQTTLYPKLGLVQLFDGEQLALVDPLAITDWQPLRELFASEHSVKMMHSCTEDLEALATIGIDVIRPLFDTQLAAELAGWGSSMGYARLVEQVTGELLDKSESRTDWLARPLTDAQLSYAANDVRFLFPLYQAFNSSFDSGHLALLLAEGELLTQRKTQHLPLEYRYLEVKQSWLLAPRELAVLRELCRWRLQYARQHDIALGLILKDFQLLELAKRRPSTTESLMNIPAMQEQRSARRHARILTELIHDAKQVPPEQCPQTFYHQDIFTGYKDVMAQLSVSVKLAAEARNIPPEFLSVKRQMHEYFNWCWRISDTERAELPLPEYLTGWRRHYLAPYLPLPEHTGFVL